jgi:hypothetical protein
MKISLLVLAKCIASQVPAVRSDSRVG